MQCTTSKHWYSLGVVCAVLSVDLEPFSLQQKNHPLLCLCVQTNNYNQHKPMAVSGSSATCIYKVSMATQYEHVYVDTEEAQS